jgi:hypothetical protein
MQRQRRDTGPGSGPAAMDVMGEAATADAGSAGPTGHMDAGDTATGGAELLEDRTIRISGGGHGRRFGVSVPGAIIGSLLVATFALGAALGPMSGESGFARGAGHDGDTAVLDPTDVVDSGDGDVAAVDGDGHGPDAAVDGDGADTNSEVDGQTPVDAEDGDAAAAQEPIGPDTVVETEPTPVPAPASVEVQIGVGLDGTAVVVEWSACEVDGFVAYKVIRSRDEFATWPLGAGDSLAATIERASTTRVVDAGADLGRTYNYRVVALRTWATETVIGCSSKMATVAIPKPTPKPEPTPGAMELALAIKEGHPFVDWSACGNVDFDYYKVVRSTDSTVTWPKGDNDSLVAAIGRDGETKAWDGEAPAGKKLFYRVFCVRSSGDGYVVLAATPVKAIETPAAAPPPDPVVLGFEAAATGEGVVLNWQACAIDNFAYYKVVRSTTTTNPSYLPSTDGTELIGVIESSSNTHFVDTNVASGQTIYYRVQCLGTWNGQKVLRGQTAVVAVTIP